MSSKRAKRHQLIVRVSNGNRAQNKRAGRKFHEIYIKFFCIPEVRLDLKPRYRNIKKELRREWHREEPYTGSYKQHKAKIIRLLISELGPGKHDLGGKTMTERILQHKKPANAPLSIKRCLGDKWDRIPAWQKGFKCCLDCGLPTMRLVYQESEVYTMLCMACGKAHRYYANSCAKAEQIYDRIDADDYKRAQHAVGLDYHNTPTGRNYFTTNGENPFKTLPSDCYGSENNCYWLTSYGYRLLGFDDMGDDRYLKILW